MTNKIISQLKEITTGREESNYTLRLRIDNRNKGTPARNVIPRPLERAGDRKKEKFSVGV